MAFPSKYCPSMCEIAAKVLSDGESLAAVCAELDITRATLYTWKEKHIEFHEAVERGLMKAQRDWEQMGRDGIIGNIEKFCASPWIFTMKNRFRDDYKEDKADNKSVSDTVIEKILDKLVD